MSNERKPQASHCFQRDVQRLDRACLQAGEAVVEIEAFDREQFARLAGFLLAKLRQIDVPPAGEAVLQVPGRLAVANEYELRHQRRFSRSSSIENRASRQLRASRRLRSGDQP
jgi:hypothetical protein